MKLLAFALLFIACTHIEEHHFPKNVAPHPLMRFEDSTVLELFEKSQLVWRLKTLYLERWESADRVFARPVFAEIYDTTGAKIALLTADSGSLDTRLTFINAYGHVHAVSSNGAAVRADSLTWDKRSNKIQTASPVRVVSEEGDVLTGKGFLSDARLDNWQIISDVKAILQDAQDRMRTVEEDSLNR